MSADTKAVEAAKAVLLSGVDYDGSDGDGYESAYGHAVGDMIAALPEAIEAYLAALTPPVLTEQPIRTPNTRGHVTRFSDSSFYDEVCTLCGATDAMDDQRLYEPCPKAPLTEQPIGRVWICSAPPGEWSPGRTVSDDRNVQGMRDKGFSCEPYVPEALAHPAPDSHAVEVLREALEAIADGEGDAIVIAQQTLAALQPRGAK